MHDVVKVEHSENVASEIVHAALKSVLCTLEKGEEVEFVFGEDSRRGWCVQIVENDRRNIGRRKLGHVEERLNINGVNCDVEPDELVLSPFVARLGRAHDLSYDCGADL